MRFAHGARRALAGACAILTLSMAACGSSGPSGSASKTTGTSGASKTTSSSGGGAASSKSSTASTAPSSGAAKATHLTVLELSSSPNPLLWFFSLAKDVGAFKKYNLNVTIRHSGGGGPQKIQALLGGQADVVTTDVISLSAAVRKGAPVVGIFVPTPFFGQDLVVNDGISSIKQLAGKAIEVPSIGGAARFLVIDVLQHAGVATSGIKWEVSPSEAARMELTDVNRSQATLIPPNEAGLIGTKYKHSKILIANTAPISGPFPNFVLATTPTIAKTKAKALDTLVEAMMYAMRVLAASPAKFGAAGVSIAPGAGYTKALLTKVDQQNLAKNGYWGENGGINMGSLNAAVKLYYQVTGQKPNSHLNSGKQLVDTQFVAAALNKLGLQKGAKDQPDWRK